MKRACIAEGLGLNQTQRVCLEGISNSQDSDIKSQAILGTPSPTPHVLSKIVYIYSGGRESGLGCPELCLKIELGGEGKQLARSG